ncbi:MAG: hypothetical protein ACTIJ9_00210 [Aequorivita sp.]
MKVTRTIYKNVLNERENLDHEEIQEIMYGGVMFSPDDGGCILEGCKCTEGHWVSINLPLDDNGDSETIFIEFKDAYEFSNFKENSTPKTKSQRI